MFKIKNDPKRKELAYGRHSLGDIELSNYSKLVITNLVDFITDFIVQNDLNPDYEAINDLNEFLNEKI